MRFLTKSPQFPSSVLSLWSHRSLSSWSEPSSWYMEVQKKKKQKFLLYGLKACAVGVVFEMEIYATRYNLGQYMCHLRPWACWLLSGFWEIPGPDNTNWVQRSRSIEKWESSKFSGTLHSFINHGSQPGEGSRSLAGSQAGNTITRPHLQSTSK